ncbi:unnamed protein product [Diamesa serratosioi]
MDRPRNIYKHKVKNINESKKPVKREANGEQDDGVKCESQIKPYQTNKNKRSQRVPCDFYNTFACSTCQ